MVQRNSVSKTVNAPQRFIKFPSTNDPAMPPTLNSMIAVAPAETGLPVCRSSAGSQNTTKYSIKRFMKKGIHSRIVPAVRPSVNKLTTGAFLALILMLGAGDGRVGKLGRNARQNS